MTLNHTPGPWEADLVTLCVCAGRQTIAELPVEPDEAQAEANARLIAEAPAMKDAIRVFLSDFDSGRGLAESLNEFRAVLARLEV